MSQVYNPEADKIAEIERMELEVREVLRRIEHARTAADKRVLNRQLQEIQNRISWMQERLP